jgi:ABC-type transport system involved in multi-copper enzyme maturation permease subunit
LTNERFVRWQGQTINHLSAALVLFSGLSVAGLGFLFSLLREASFKPTGVMALLFLVAILSLLIASLSGSAAVVTRLLDFRLTAQKTRYSDVEPLTFFCTDSSGYGRATWRLFWTLLISFCIGISLSSIVVGKIYLGEIFCAIGF